MRWADGCNRGMEAIGRDGMKVYKYKAWLEEIGCEYGVFLGRACLKRRNCYNDTMRPLHTDANLL